MEETLQKWIHKNYIMNNKPITAKMIKTKALKLAKCKDFIASKGWLEKFKKKFKIFVCTEREYAKLNKEKE
jgi:hypothetical protein